MAEPWKPIIQYAIVACEEIKVQLVLQFGVSRGLRGVLLAPVGRVYLSEIVSKFEPKTWPRCRDRETRIISTQFPTVKAIFRSAEHVPIFIFWRRMMDLRRFM